MTAPKARLDSRLRGNDNWERGIAANANFGTCGNDNGNDGGKWELSIAAPIFVVGNPSVMVLIKNAVIAVVIILSGVITSIVEGVAAFVILVSVVIGGLVCISVVVEDHYARITDNKYRSGD